MPTVSLRLQVYTCTCKCVHVHKCDCIYWREDFSVEAFELQFWNKFYMYTEISQILKVLVKNVRISCKL